MGPNKTIVLAENGVVLTRIELMSGSNVVSTSYTVASRRTPVVQNFTEGALAERAYREELAASSAD